MPLLPIVCVSGLSPHVRGNPRAPTATGWRWRSIPARAGEPGRSCSSPRRPTVYPRTCGGTLVYRVPLTRLTGLSPHVRGNRGQRPQRRGRHGSIPARAGEPRAENSTPLPSRVYPRTCGGTKRVGKRIIKNPGLSPHVRGNQITLRPLFRLFRSIPARAGEPQEVGEITISGGVYPRTCGGTRQTVQRGHGSQGLSPHVRGNLSCRAPGSILRGSIPARAGEPCVGDPAGMDSGVYPRTCGGTVPAHCSPPLGSGLSPHVRGNHYIPDGWRLPSGSIPARAGEPRSSRSRSPRPRVYPRTCGGTWRTSSLPSRNPGLSPHVRGNLSNANESLTLIGSIPARAGEPYAQAGRPCCRWVYPRTCGGTMDCTAAIRDP